MHQSQKTLEFLQKIKDKGFWNDNLDYSKGVYTSSREPLEVKGIIIGSEDDLKIRRALSVTTNIEFYKYKVNFKLHQ